MNDSLTIRYLKSIIGALAFSKRLLVWDAYRCHVSEAVRRECDKLRLHTAVVPGGCTKYIQAADVVWTGSFKSHMRSHYDARIAEPVSHQYTRGGNMNGPSHALLCQWVKSSWEAVSVASVKESFSSCAITTSTDGSQDNEIHCFKPGQPCAGGKNVLAEATRTLVSSASENEHEYPFADVDNEEEAEANEACIDESEGEHSDSADESNTSGRDITSDGEI